MAEPRPISSRDNPLLQRIRKLAADPGGYRKLGEVWIEGDHLCAAFVKRGGRALQAVLTRDGWHDPALRALADSATSSVTVTPELMAGLSTLESPPSIGFVVVAPTVPALAPDQPSVVLDRLQDAGNVGAILRSAAAFGFAQVLALKGTAALWSPKVLRAGMGAHFGLRLVEGLQEEALAGLTVPLLATSSHATQALHEVLIPWPCAWVMGHEGHGISAALRARCQRELRIPQPGGEESLNAAAAAAVCFYESVRQRAAQP
ncbi:MAG TPA: RNA methyltransferase [Burkholderiaceae bacterium]|nr:RNA methyltransferase [Burkholderiaceae bacterium]